MFFGFLLVNERELIGLKPNDNKRDPDFTSKSRQYSPPLIVISLEQFQTSPIDFMPVQDHPYFADCHVCVSDKRCVIG